MKVLGFVLVFSLSVPALARMGDSVEQTAARYGHSVAASGAKGDLTSTRTFAISGLQVTCGYVNGKVEMETYARDDRNFIGPEVEALLRTNGSKKIGWTLPADGYVDGDYKRADGVTAKLDGNKLAIQSTKWTDALAKDQAAKAAAEKAAQETASTNTANPNYTAGYGTNAASYVPSANTNAASLAPTPTSSTTTITTNAP